jgi:hypothetical protein
MSNTCFAQIKMAYSIGSLGNTNQKTAVFSGVVAINGNSCFLLSNGISTFSNGKPGLFTSNCDVVLNNNTGNLVQKFVLIAYPNPVITTVMIKSIDQLPTVDVLNIVVYSTIGQPVKKISLTARQLYEGQMIDMRGWTMGMYIVKVTSLHASSEYKLIKEN